LVAVKSKIEKEKKKKNSQSNKRCSEYWMKGSTTE